MEKGHARVSIHRRRWKMPQNVEIEEEESKIELENQRPDNVCAKGMMRTKGNSQLRDRKSI